MTRLVLALALVPLIACKDHREPGLPPASAWGSSADPVAVAPPPLAVDRIAACLAAKLVHDTNQLQLGGTYVASMIDELQQHAKPEVARLAIAAIVDHADKLTPSDVAANALAHAAAALAALGADPAALAAAERAITAALAAHPALEGDKDDAVETAVGVLAREGKHDRALEVAGSVPRVRTALATAYAKAHDQARATALLQGADPAATIETLVWLGRDNDARALTASADPGHRAYLAFELASAEVDAGHPDAKQAIATAIAACEALSAPSQELERFHRMVALAHLRDQSGDVAGGRAMRAELQTAVAPGTKHGDDGMVLGELAIAMAIAGDLDDNPALLERVKHSGLGDLMAPAAMVEIALRRHDFKTALATVRASSGVTLPMLVEIFSRYSAAPPDPAIDKLLLATACPTP